MHGALLGLLIVIFVAILSFIASMLGVKGNFIALRDLGSMAGKHYCADDCLLPRSSSG
jgi:hypothetical protein